MDSRKKSEKHLATPYNVHLFHEGSHFESHEFMGAHITKKAGLLGVNFNVWAPKAREVSIVGDFNGWNGQANLMKKIDSSGVWNLFIPDLKERSRYKFRVVGRDGKERLKSDPYGFYTELRPDNASVVYEMEGYDWNDSEWMRQRANTNPYEKPVNIYEVHLGSWKRKWDGEFFNMEELEELIDYVIDMGYTHIELLPIMEHPLDQSWGYQTTGYYSFTSRHGEPKDFMRFIDKCHQRGIGVILDWTLSHFCKDDNGLYKFDGGNQFEYEDQTKAENVAWGTAHFDLGKPEVQSFLISNAVFWMEKFHIDGIRVDAVASMLYLDYDLGPWRPNKYGGRENLEAIDFMRKFNKVMFERIKNPLIMAEESTSWPLVTAPAYIGGLGFNYKWNMGWMNDTLKYMEMDPIHRKWHHSLITFSFMYAFTENFILPLSHDEVVHGKKSLLDKLPGDFWQRRAGLRLLLSYQMIHPGKKLLFMGCEFGQGLEWRYAYGLEWHLLEREEHKKLQNFTRDINNLYKNEASLYLIDHSYKGFDFIDPNNTEQSIIVLSRKGKTAEDFIIGVLNFTPQVYYDYKIGVPFLGEYQEVLNSDDEKYSGSGQVMGDVELIAEAEKWHNQKYNIKIKVPPLGAVFIKPKRIDMQEGIENDEKRDDSNDSSRGTRV